MKKKQFFCWLFMLLLVLGVVPVFAADTNQTRVVDEASLLSESEISALQQKTDQIAGKYDFDVVIVTVNSLDGKTAEEYADDYYDYHDYRNDGILLLTAMDDRKWHISTTGKGIEYFTDYGCEYIGDKVKEKLSDGDYNAAYETFVKECDSFLKEAQNGTPYDVGHEKHSIMFFVVPYGIAFLVSVIFAICYVADLKHKLNTTTPTGNAAVYIKNIHKQKDQDEFIRSFVTTVARPQSSSSSRGGSSTHTSSSGRSHGGTGGSF